MVKAFSSGSVSMKLTHCQDQRLAPPPVGRIERSVTFGRVSGIVEQSATAVKTLFSFVCIPLV